MTVMATARSSLRRQMVLRRLASALVQWAQSARRRRGLHRYIAAMDDATLADVGVSRAQLEFEIDRQC